MSEKPYGYIYKTKFPDGRYYIGQSKGSIVRKNYFGSGIYIRKYLSSHSSDTLQIEILTWVFGEQPELNSAEAEYVKERYREDPLCVNLRPGGNQAGASDAFREKMRKINTGRKLSSDTRLKLSILRSGSGNSFYGRKHSEETREKMRKPHKTYTRKLST